MQIKLNGKAYETAASDLDGLKREVKFSGEIAVINGYASTQN
ncbi:ThiS-like ubiquitin domain-containing protein, partial [uncultured Campylobacter sp.]